MKELIFQIEDDPEGGFTARGLGESIFTDGNSWKELKTNIKDAVKCHFDESEIPKVIRLHYVKDEIMEVAS
ncbi:hypothetical protein [Flexistipes sp.]|uniref:hypothetical protein n=1 Tax=Flexistipes sp. TaxID=3088135 RepID=UPI002E1AEB72|nr:hypothetical protein [Flexistipes sp.]